MVFNSLVFLAFLAVILLLYYRLGHRAQNAMLLAASYFFYGWWDYRFVALLLFTSLFDYFCAIWIDGETRPGRRRLLLASSMAVNLGVLCIFKYFNFFAQSLQSCLGVLGITLSFPMLHVVLPIGISFYTFLSMSYTIDVYRRELKATRHPTEFLLYVAFFPHLVAGPIVRASLLLPQCQRPRTIVPAEVANGIWLMLMGYVKKVVIADRLAQSVNGVFSGQAILFSDANSWLVLYAFAFQIYGDFSGYSDIARGVSKLMGFELVENFRAPYLVTNASSFWRNWHISLSTWLRDYLYVPLGGNRRGRFNTYRNLMLTMLLGGLWHGAGVAYVAWGLYHGILLAIQRAWNDLTGAVRSAIPLRSLSPEGMGSVRAAAQAPELAASGALAKKALLAVLFFHLICVGWLLFRAGSLPAGVSQLGFIRHYLGTLLVPPRGISPMVQGVLFLGALSLFFQWRYDAMNRFSTWPTVWQAFGVVGSITAITCLGVFEGAQFIYFKF